MKVSKDSIAVYLSIKVFSNMQFTIYVAITASLQIRDREL
jgi:hypothetical protein